MAGLEQAVRQGRTPVALWWSLWAGFIAFGLDLGFSYVLAQHTCSASYFTGLHIVSLISFLVALSGFACGLLDYRRIPAEAKNNGSRPIDRAHFQAVLGMAFSLSFAVAIIAEAVPRWIFSPCN